MTAFLAQRLRVDQDVAPAGPLVGSMHLRVENEDLASQLGLAQAQRKMVQEEKDTLLQAMASAHRFVLQLVCAKAHEENSAGGEGHAAAGECQCPQ
eukprot:1159300-Pelagomonas_calceolata.AAC.1